MQRRETLRRDVLPRPSGSSPSFLRPARFGRAIRGRKAALESREGKARLVGRRDLIRGRYAGDRPFCLRASSETARPRVEVNLSSKVSRHQHGARAGLSPLRVQKQERTLPYRGSDEAKLCPIIPCGKPRAAAPSRPVKPMSSLQGVGREGGDMVHRPCAPLLRRALCLWRGPAMRSNTAAPVTRTIQPSASKVAVVWPTLMLSSSHLHTQQDGGVGKGAQTQPSRMVRASFCPPRLA